ncbi:unnamed protein product [Paramecium sonneborni]|uniref:Uncharacterized protein n=1 Tax=Paramecium sonneborni TaxID=65129 RepID=A0A8S1RQT4_9CILI|nr:unnamed protein product [Paramecium sonneborni]
MKVLLHLAEEDASWLQWINQTQFQNEGKTYKFKCVKYILKLLKVIKR